MTVTTSYEPVKQLGTGSILDFEFNFKVFTTGDVEVYLQEQGQSPVLQVFGFSISLINNGLGGGIVSFINAPSSTTSVIIARNIINTQETPFITSGKFEAEKHEDSFDKRTLISQQQQENIDRAIRFPIGTDNVNNELPLPDNGKVIGWENGSLSNLTIVDTTGEILPAEPNSYIKRSSDNTIYESLSSDELTKDLTYGTLLDLESGDLEKKVYKADVIKEYVDKKVFEETGLPKNYITEFNTQYLSPTKIAISGGNCRDSKDLVDMLTEELAKQQAENTRYNNFTPERGNPIFEKDNNRWNMTSTAEQGIKYTVPDSNIWSGDFSIYLDIEPTQVNRGSGIFGLNSDQIEQIVIEALSSNKILLRFSSNGTSFNYSATGTYDITTNRTQLRFWRDKLAGEYYLDYSTDGLPTYNDDGTLNLSKVWTNDITIATSDNIVEVPSVKDYTFGLKTYSSTNTWLNGYIHLNGTSWIVEGENILRPVPNAWDNEKITANGFLITDDGVVEFNDKDFSIGEFGVGNGAFSGTTQFPTNNTDLLLYVVYNSLDFENTYTLAFTDDLATLQANLTQFDTFISVNSNFKVDGTGELIGSIDQTFFLSKTLDSWQAGNNVGGAVVSFNPNDIAFVFVVSDVFGNLDVAFDDNKEGDNIKNQIGYDFWRMVGTILLNGAGEFYDFISYGNSNKRRLEYKTAINQTSGGSGTFNISNFPIPQTGIKILHGSFVCDSGTASATSFSLKSDVSGLYYPIESRGQSGAGGYNVPDAGTYSIPIINTATVVSSGISWVMLVNGYEYEV